MNDFYEHKANKYKYKYLELKKRIEYNGINGAYNGVGGVGGVGCFSGFCRSNKNPPTLTPAELNVKINDERIKIKNSYDKLSDKDKETFRLINEAIAQHNYNQKGQHIELQFFKDDYNHERFFKDYCTQIIDHGDHIQYKCLTIEQIEQQKQDIERRKIEKSLADRERNHKNYLVDLEAQQKINEKKNEIKIATQIAIKELKEQDPSYTPPLYNARHNAPGYLNETRHLQQKINEVLARLKIGTA